MKKISIFASFLFLFFIFSECSHLVAFVLTFSGLACKAQANTVRNKVKLPRP